MNIKNMYFVIGGQEIREIESFYADCQYFCIKFRDSSGSDMTLKCGLEQVEVRFSKQKWGEIMLMMLEIFGTILRMIAFLMFIHFVRKDNKKAAVIYAVALLMSKQKGGGSNGM